jgi:hypothetical protein
MRLNDDAPPRRPWVAAVELLAGAAVVIGHNALRVIPNEVPILVIGGLISSRIWTGRWRVSALGRPSSWPRTLAIAVAAAGLRIVLGDFVIDPLTSRFWPPAVAPAGASEITGHLGVALLALLIVWTFAAFGEEFAYRQYLLTRAAAALGGSSAAYWLAVVAGAVLFGFGHYYKGPAGIVDSAVAGLILGAAFMLSGRNLWAPILAHGLIDTCGVALVFLGRAS